MTSRIFLSTMALFLEFYRYIRVQARIPDGHRLNVALKKSGVCSTAGKCVCSAAALPVFEDGEKKPWRYEQVLPVPR